MVIKAFPPVSEATPEGLLALGGDLEPESLLLAYKSGVFPWPLNEEILAWFAPPKRAVLYLDELHVSRSLKKEIQSGRFSIEYNRDFQGVIERCAELKNRKEQLGTWITPQVMDAYTTLHELGHAFSVEAYEDGKLAGGLYGISIGEFISGESMFYRSPDASKVALVTLCRNLKGRGIDWIDCQVMTPHMKHFGARLVARKQFMKLLEKALDKKKSIVL